MQENDITARIVDAAIEVHRTLGGPGLLESVYEEALYLELQHRDVVVERQLNIPVRYKGALLATPLRLDLLVENAVIVECKAVNEFNEIFITQLMTYLRVANCRVELVINFGEKLLKDGIRRVINTR